MECANRCLDRVKRGEIPFIDDCASKCNDKMVLCKHCCAIREATATEAHCEAVCGENFTAYVCN
jgi:hypothetical protein